MVPPMMSDKYLSEIKLEIQKHPHFFISFQNNLTTPKPKNPIMHTFTIITAFLLFQGTTDPDRLPAPQFEAEVIDAQVSIGYGLAIGDVDGDGTPDILLADKEQIVWYRNGDWKRTVMAENITEFDNVAIAARDINGDGQVEVAVGAQWNVRETSDPDRSGSVHYLIRPEDPADPWEVADLHHEPTVHRMKWVQLADGRYSLVVVPLHGRGNVNGEGNGVRIYAYQPPENPRDPWDLTLLDDNMNMTHNFDVVSSDANNTEMLYIGSRQGVRTVQPQDGEWVSLSSEELPGIDRGIGEIRYGSLGDADFLATIEPMHGNEVAVYLMGDEPQRYLLDDTLNQGHALATADLLGLGRDQIIAGWRNSDEDGRVGIKLFVPVDETGTQWETYLIDDNNMATEDLIIADLDGDGRPEIIAAGRATNNLIIYWNRTGD